MKYVIDTLFNLAVRCWGQPEFRDPNLSIKCPTPFSVNNSQIRLIFLMQIDLKLLLIQVLSIAIKICQISTNESDFGLSQKLWISPK